MEEIKEKNIELRKLNGGDIFPMAKIINKIGLKEFSSVFTSERLMNMVSNYSKDGDKNLEQENIETIGLSAVMDIVGIIFDNLGKCREDLGKFLASLSGRDPKTFWEDCDFEEPLLILEALVKKPEFENFYRVVLKYLR